MSKDNQNVYAGYSGAKIGSKAGRMARIVRLFRLIRLVKLYKQMIQALENEAQKHQMLEELKGDSNLHNLAKSTKLKKSNKQERGHTNKVSFKKALSKVLNEVGSDTKEEDAHESKVGTKLTARISKKVIILLMIMLLCQPLQDQMTYISEPDSFQHGLKLIYQLGGGSTEVGKKQFEYMIEIQQNLSTPLIALYVNHVDAPKLKWESEICNFRDLRDIEIVMVTSNIIPSEHYYVAIYDVRHILQLQSGLSLIQTIVVCMILTLGALMFQKITSDLVIKPIEQMIERVNHISKDPLQAAHEEEERLLFE